MEAQWVRTVLRNALLALLYAGFGHAMLRADEGIGVAAPLWPAAGIAFAFVYVYGPRLAPGVFVGSFIVNAPGLLTGSLDTGEAVLAAVLFAIGATLRAVVGSELVQRLVPRTHLSNAAQIVTFILLAGPLATLIAATGGVVLQWWFGVIPAAGIAEAWLTWWSGDSIGVAVFAPLTLMCMREQDAIWEGRRAKIAVPVGIAFVLAFIALSNDVEVRTTQAQMRMDSVAKAAASALDRTIVSHLEALEGVRGLFLASEYISAAEFAAYTASPLERLPGLHAVSWNPVLSGSAISEFENHQRTAERIDGFTATEKAADGSLVPVALREQHVLVGYIEPLAANRTALGFDILSNPTRAMSIRAAFEKGTLQATAPIDLVQETGSQKGVLVLLPIEDERGHINAFAVGVLRVGDLLRNTFDKQEWANVRVRLLDVTSPNAPALLGTIGDFAQTSSSSDGDDHAPVISRYFTVGDRDWQLSIRPTAEYFASLEGGSRPGTLVGLDLLFLMLMAFLLLMSGQEQQARRAAHRSSFEALHDPLTGLLNRRGFDERLQEMRESAVRDGSPHVLMFMDLDGFKPINDTHGHDAGDAMLVAIANALHHSVRDSDIVARIGGDEFCVILNNCPPDRGLEIARNITVAVAERVLDWHGSPISVLVSVGVVNVQGAAIPTAEELLRRADMACYDSKRSGGGNVRVYQTTSQY